MLRSIRTDLEGFNCSLQGKPVRNELGDVAEDSVCDETENDGPRLGVAKTGDHVDLPETHAHDRELDV